MKKAIAVLIALLMVFSLVACTQGATTESPAASSSTPAASPSEAGTTQEPSPSAIADISAGANSVGFFESGVDPASRDTYDIVFCYPRQNVTMQNIADRLKDYETMFNIKSSSYCANNDMDAYLQNVEILIDQGTDGFLMVFDPATRMRFIEVLEEANKPVTAILNSVRDDNGSEIIPCAGIEGVLASATTVQWLFDNYKTYWGDIDTSKIGLLDYNFSVNVDFNDRFEGAKAQFEKLLPGNPVFEADGVAGKLDEQTGYDLASATFAAHPEVEYWFAAACIEQYGAGAARAAETMNIDKTVLVTDVGSNQLVSQWDAGYDGCWVSCMAVSDYQYLIPPLCGLIAILDGKATIDTLWSTLRAPGDTVTFYAIPPVMVTKDSYKAFFDKVLQEAGIA